MHWCETGIFSFFTDKIEKGWEKIHGIGLRDGFLLQWYWMNFGRGLVAFNPCFKKKLDEMNFKCVTSLVSKSYQPESGHIRCTKNITCLDALDRSISYSSCLNVIFWAHKGAPTQRMKSTGTSAGGFHLVQYDALVWAMNLRVVPMTEVPTACSCLHPRRQHLPE